MAAKVDAASIEEEKIIESVSESATDSSSRVSLTWKNITYSITSQNKSSQALKSVTGFANPGEILAIMGSSGSGKTSLLSILSNQVIPQSNISITGCVELNGTDIKKLNYSLFAKYVMQQDILLPTLTPREALMFSARLKIRESYEAIKIKIEKLMEELKLTRVADNLIGNETIKGLSGGEKKRICIGLELISEPSILILDEPTSGLDSFTAEIVVSLLKRQANKGRTIILTIHQPSTQIFSSFDRLILMAEGNFVYQGQTLKSIEYFKDIGYQCPEHTNPPDYYMRILYIGNRNNMTEAEVNKLKLFNETYKSIEQEVLTEINLENLSRIDNKIAQKHANLVVELSELLKRSFLNSLRNPMLSFVKIFNALVMSAILDLIFRNLGYDLQGVNSREGVLFFTVINYIMAGMSSNSMTFPVEKPIFLKEYKENLYGVVPYFFSKFLAELPIQILVVILYSLMLYFAVNFNINSASEFFVFTSISLVIALVGNQYGNIGGAISKDVVAATVIAPTLTAPLMMFGGFFGNSKSLFVGFSWIKYISGFYYGYNALVYNELDGLKLDSSVTQNPLDTIGVTSKVWESVGCLLIMLLIQILIVLVILKITAHSYKNK